MKHSCFGSFLSSYFKRQLSFSKLRVSPTFSRHRCPYINLAHIRCYGSATSFSWRTHTCGELRREHVDQKVCLCGWLQFKRSKFVTLRDSYGATQLLVRPTTEESHVADKLEKLALESVIQISGVVKNRIPGQESKTMATGDIEVLIDSLNILSESKPRLPFVPRDFQKVSELLRLQHRYIDLRNPELQHNLRLRSNVVMKVREFLFSEGFVDVETPTLFRQTPGGAHEFIVPTRHPDLFYALTQSPQQFKQLLMIGGLDKYYQIARCYRDEQSRSDRQPEFTQIDIEMSFVKPEGIFSLIEAMLRHCWPDHLPRITIPFPKMTYAEAMRDYGVDKPDTRFEIKLQDVPSFLMDRVPFFKSDSSLTTDFCVKAIVVPNFSPFFTRSVQNGFLDEAKHINKNANLAFVRIGEDLSWSSSLNKYIDGHVHSKANEVFNSHPNDVIIFCYGKSEAVHALIVTLRVQSASKLEENGKFESMHHPFTAAHPDDIELIYSDPAKVRALHYDLVLNGLEIGGGSIRIHDSALQKYVIQNVLKEDPSQLTHLTDALESGCPPHGGIALGLDRLIAIMCNATSIRDVIAFPKSLEGKDLMANAPAHISATERKRYHLK